MSMKILMNLISTLIAVTVSIFQTFLLIKMSKSSMRYNDMGNSALERKIKNNRLTFKILCFVTYASTVLIIISSVLNI